MLWGFQGILIFTCCARWHLTSRLCKCRSLKPQRLLFCFCCFCFCFFLCIWCVMLGVGGWETSIDKKKLQIKKNKNGGFEGKGRSHREKTNRNLMLPGLLWWCWRGVWIEHGDHNRGLSWKEQFGYQSAANPHNLLSSWKVHLYIQPVSLPSCI
jgi:hypothetical protein